MPGPLEPDEASTDTGSKFSIPAFRAETSDDGDDDDDDDDDDDNDDDSTCLNLHG